MADVQEVDIDLSVNGGVMEVLSEHLCEGWFEGYLLTGRHELFFYYEAFVQVVDSMFSQHAKWLMVSRNIPWRKRIASLNCLLTSHVGRQDQNGFSHQDPGFIDHVANKKSDVVRIYQGPQHWLRRRSCAGARSPRRGHAAHCAATVRPSSRYSELSLRTGRPGISCGRPS
jgi:xylulose-5-phosphate/fructose-6-phosphate phosphoketolase